MAEAWGGVFTVSFMRLSIGAGVGVCLAVGSILHLGTGMHDEAVVNQGRARPGHATGFRFNLSTSLSSQTPRHMYPRRHAFTLSVPSRGFQFNVSRPLGCTLAAYRFFRTGDKMHVGRS